MKMLEKVEYAVLRRLQKTGRVVPWGAYSCDFIFRLRDRGFVAVNPVLQRMPFSEPVVEYRLTMEGRLALPSLLAARKL